MGYRSEILSAVIFADETHSIETMVKWKLACSNNEYTDPLTHEMLGEHVTYTKVGGHPCILLRGEGWKWYESYPDVQAWRAFLVWTNEEGASTTFLRIGEDPRDVIHEIEDGSRMPGGFWPGDYFNVKREITCDLSENDHD